MITLGVNAHKLSDYYTFWVWKTTRPEGDLVLFFVYVVLDAR